MKFIDQEDKIIKYYIKTNKRFRLKINKYQEEILNRAYDESPYLDDYTKIQLQLLTNIPLQNLKIWFQNKRSRMK